MRTICWFSAGAASAIASALTLADTPDAVIAYIDPGSEHPDNARFLSDCERWLGIDIVRLRSDRYRDTWQVWEERRWLNGPEGALCTAELKKMVRYGFERPDDVQVFGYTSEESDRAERFRDQNPGVELRTPLIEQGLSKTDCLALLQKVGIEIPVMYRLGYRNNNCVGCVKGGMGYWNKIRVDFPDVFDRMATLERRIGHSLLKDKHGPVYLDELDPRRGRHSDLEIDCSLVCQDVELPDAG